MTVNELKAAMRELGYTPERWRDYDRDGTKGVIEFAAEVGVSGRTVYYWLDGSSMSQLAVRSIQRMLEGAVR